LFFFFLREVRILKLTDTVYSLLWHQQTQLRRRPVPLSLKLWFGGTTNRQRNKETKQRFGWPAAATLPIWLLTGWLAVIPT
jgi:hypothetical protein